MSARKSIRRGASTQDEPPRTRAADRSSSAAKVFYAAVFLSAFLLFQVQPLVSKAILPWFGGGPAVWTTSMLFFQVVLLAGYCYAHFAARFLSPAFQWGVYAILIVVGVALSPVYPDEQWKPTGETLDPTLRILRVLGATVGVQFLLLATTAPLLQVWWHRIWRQTPYRLYALSNAGSLLGLTTYPFLFEPRLGVHGQTYLWSAAFACLGALLLWCATLSWRAGAVQETTQAPDDAEPAATWRAYAAWIGLSCCGSVLLLAMTSHISQNVAVVPLLWVAPLALYLLSFILAFGDARFYHRGACGGLLIVTLLGCAMLYNFDLVQNVILLLAIHLAGMFAGCMLCHGELVRRRPAARQLTAFYVSISLGGAAGGLFVSLVAPRIFLRYYEYPLVLIACWLIMMWVALRDPGSRLHAGRPLWAWGLLLCLFLAFVTQLRNGMVNHTAAALLTFRDFYGVLTVRRTHSDVPGLDWAQLGHGMILHGAQYLDQDKQYEPTMYYVRQGGLGAAMRRVAGKSNKRVGVLGLGIGATAAYCEAGDSFRFYEIDPNVIRIATNPGIFTFWTLFEQRGATGSIVAGDARISLERELARGQPQAFDVLVLDVFTGDAVPVHLLTREAFALYFQHLAPQGVLAVHISNRHLDLLPVVRTMAAENDVAAALVVDAQASEWVLLAGEEAMAKLQQDQVSQVTPLTRLAGGVPWTDDYSNIFSVLK